MGKQEKQIQKKYPTVDSENGIKQKLDEMGIDIFEPMTRFEESIAVAMEEFSTFVLSTHQSECLGILEANEDDSVGELQGGNDNYCIYRVSFPDDDVDDDDDENHDDPAYQARAKNAAVRLLHEFNNANGRTRGSTTLTMQKVKQYMLRMLERRTNHRGETTTYSTLGNCMFILQFGGPTSGQVRHIDNMVSNVQICLYMSSQCPTTIVYSMDDDDGDGVLCAPIEDCISLLEHWERRQQQRQQQHYSSSAPVLAKSVSGGVPAFIRDILQTQGGIRLVTKWYTKYFSFWKTLDIHLHCFGKLYQDVALELGLPKTDPGTTLLAGGNEVHAGPPTTGSRMFAFAIGIPDEDLIGGDDGCGDQPKGGVVCDNLNADNNNNNNTDDNDGEVQYSPVTLHLDLCCVLFGILDYDDRYSKRGQEENRKEAKRFLLDVLLHLIRDDPMRIYLRQIEDDRPQVKGWLKNILDALELNNEQTVASLVQEAVESDFIFYSPDVIKKRSKRKKKERKKRCDLHRTGLELFS